MQLIIKTKYIAKTIIDQKKFLIGENNKFNFAVKGYIKGGNLSYEDIFALYDKFIRNLKTKFATWHTHISAVKAKYPKP